MRNIVVTAFALIATLTAGAFPVHASDEVLFNGKDLTGWHFVMDKTGANTDGHMKVNDIFTVRDGVIRAVGNSINAYIRTDKEYQDYRLHVEWRWVSSELVDGQRNAGVWVHVQGPDKIWPIGYELEIAKVYVNGFWVNTGDLIPNCFSPAECETLIGAGGIKSFKSDPKFINPKEPLHRIRFKDAEKPDGQWNSYDAELTDGRLKVMLNGELVNEGTAPKALRGSILLQSEITPIEYRNIRVTSLKAAR
jgi:hypothetical protein